MLMFIKEFVALVCAYACTSEVCTGKGLLHEYASSKGYAWSLKYVEERVCCMGMHEQGQVSHCCLYVNPPLACKSTLACMLHSGNPGLYAACLYIVNPGLLLVIQPCSFHRLPVCL